MSDKSDPKPSSSNFFEWFAIVILILIRLISLSMVLIWPPNTIVDFPLRVRSCVHAKTQVMIRKMVGQPFRLWRRFGQIMDACSYDPYLDVHDFHSSSGLALYHVPSRNQFSNNTLCRIVSINDALHMDAEEKLTIATGCEFYASDPNIDQPSTFHTRFASYRVLLEPWSSPALKNDTGGLPAYTHWKGRSETIDLQTLLSKKFGVHNMENLIIGPFRYNAEFRDFFHSGIFHRLGSRLCQVNIIYQQPDMISATQFVRAFWHILYRSSFLVHKASKSADDRYMNVKSEEDPALTMRDNCAPNSSASVFVWTTIVLLVLIRLLSLLIYFIWAPDGLADYPLKVRACLHDKTQVMTYRRKGDPFRLWKRLSQIANGCAYNQELIVKEFSSSSGLSLYHVSRRKRLYSDRRCKIVSINDALHMDAEEKLALSTGCKFYASDLNITEPSGFHTKFASYRVLSEPKIRKAPKNDTGEIQSYTLWSGQSRTIDLRSLLTAKFGVHNLENLIVGPFHYNIEFRDFLDPTAYNIFGSRLCQVNIIYEHPDIVSAAQFVRSFRQILYRSSFLILRTSRSADDRYMNIFALNYVDRHCAVRHFANSHGFLAKVLPDNE
ncbi:hypothetical protein Q1695_007600 [Nippostrongylus brasiliensis]|nr:hypothetical protein Q1695_007600 [Nippostrongylus brasiliensis]